MKAAVYSRYGPPDVVRIADVEEPAPKDGEVLIKVRAASVNPMDWHFMRGSPSFVRLMTGLRQPKIDRLGVDAAGRVERVGGNVTEFKAGDDVFGTCRGALAEFACAAESALTAKPENVTFEQAAAAPVAALTALQGLRNKGQVQAGQRVLVNGAAGGVGTFAIQIAKWLGAEATGVCSSRNVEMVRRIGADRVFDYTKKDFTKSGQHYDVIFDLAGNHSLPALRRALKPGGTYVGAGGGGPDTGSLDVLARSLKVVLLSLFVKEKLRSLLTKANKADLIVIGDLMRRAIVTPVIDRVLGLSDVAEAIRYLEGGHARGKVVISLD